LVFVVPTLPMLRHADETMLVRRAATVSLDARDEIVE
jgi:hypothetical protein